LNISSISAGTIPTFDLLDLYLPYGFFSYKQEQALVILAHTNGNFQWSVMLQRQAAFLQGKRLVLWV
jgi:hypothetical protein